MQLVMSCHTLFSRTDYQDDRIIYKELSVRSIGALTKFFFCVCVRLYLASSVILFDGLTVNNERDSLFLVLVSRWRGGGGRGGNLTHTKE